MDTNQLHIVIKAIDFSALFAFIGLLLARVALLPQEVFSMSGVTRKWHWLLGGVLALLAVSGLALLLFRVMQMGGGSVGQALALLPSVLRQTHFGKVWALHFLGLLVLWIGWVVSARVLSQWPATFMLAVSYAMALTYSASSHAADTGDFTLAEFIDCLHLISAGTWGGGIVVSALFLFPVFGKIAKQDRTLLAEMVFRLSTLSAVAVVLVAGSGVFNMYARLGHLDNLLHSSYGHVLAVKLMLVATMLAIGGINRVILAPKIRRWAEAPETGNGNPVRWLNASIKVDVVLVLLILTAASVLIQGMPPAAERYMPGMTGHAHK
jgi:putative copper resistance protein D